jgi:hypothetical protein
LKSESRSEANLKKRIAEAAGVNEKTLQRQASNLLVTLAGVSEEELRKDPALRMYLRYIFFGEPVDPKVITLEEPEKDESGQSA